MQKEHRGWRVWLSRLAPYFFAALALAWVFHTTDLEKLKEALRHADLKLFILFSAVILVANCAADTFAMHRVFGWFGCHVPYTELFVIRASTYLLAVINYHVGQAAIVGYLYRARRVPLLQATGWILFIIGVNVGTLFLLASGGAWKATGTLSFLHVIPIATVAGAVVWAILLAVRPRVLAERRVLRPLFEMGIVGHLRGVLVRLPHVAVLIVWHLVSLRMFGVRVPVLDALLFLPIYFATSSLPINVNGLGAAQLVAVAFFSRYAADPSAGRAAVIAYSLGTSLVSIFLQLGLGLICLGRATKLGLPREAPEQIEAEAARAVAADATLADAEDKPDAAAEA
jgi:hypothetical protein